MDPLSEELDALPSPLKAELRRYRFDRELFLDLARQLVRGDTDNRVSDPVAAPEPESFVEIPTEEEARRNLEERGLRLLEEGSAALVVLAGGMATRMGGVVKALEEALPGKTFLDLRLAEQRAVEKRTGKKPPLWLMTSAATDAKIRAYLGPALDDFTLATFPQRLGLRLTPEGNLFRDAEGAASDHAPGHGDLPDALRDSGLLERFVAGGGKTLTIGNLDNLGATLDPLLLGIHESSERPLTCEVVEKVGSDRGGIPVRLGDRTVVLEEFRLPEGFDAASVPVFNTNTFHVDAAALLDERIRWTYFTVKKTVGGRTAIQFERLLAELTSHMDTTYCRVPRVGEGSRFLPVKDRDELAKRRPEIERVARAKGMLA